jgi:hypothetical protein
VFGHYYISVHEEVVAGAYCFEGPLKEVASFGVSEIGETLVTTEGYEVEMISGLLVSNETSFVMADILLPTSQKRDVGHPAPGWYLTYYSVVSSLATEHPTTQ